MTVVQSERKEKLVGGLTFVALIIAILASYGQKDEGARENAYEIQATFERIDGLADDAEVRMGGVNIGQVVGARLNENYRAVIRMSIEDGIELPVDTSAAIHTDGLFGSKFIELEPGGEEKMILDGGVIDVTQRSVVVEELLELIISEGKAKRAQAQAN